MPAQGWSRFASNSGHPGWVRRIEERREMLFYIHFKGEDSLCFKWGFDLAQKKLPRSFAQQIAADHGGLFAQAFLAGFDSFSRPQKERFRGDE
jgi:ribosomal protein L16/L10AE